MSVVDPKLVSHIATLANLPMSSAQATALAPQLDSVLEYTKQVGELDTDGVEETSQVTGLENILREDVIDPTRMFTQKQALANAVRTANGYFVVPAVFEES